MMEEGEEKEEKPKKKLRIEAGGIERAWETGFDARYVATTI